MDVSDEERPDESFVSDEEDLEDADNELLYLKPEEELLLEQARMMRDALDDSYYQAQANSNEKGCDPEGHSSLCTKKTTTSTSQFQFNFITKHRIS